MGLDSSHTNFYFVKEVVFACLKQHGQGHVCRVYERKVIKPLYIVPDRFSSSLDRREELVHGNLGVILIESREKFGFQVNLKIDGAIGKAPEPIKGYPFEGADE